MEVNLQFNILLWEMLLSYYIKNKGSMSNRLPVVLLY